MTLSENIQNIFGTEFEMLNDWMLDSIISNKYDRFCTDYPKYLKLAIAYRENIRISLLHSQRNLSWVVDKVNTPIIDFICMSSYAYLWGEINADEKWKSLLEPVLPNLADRFVETYTLWKKMNTADISSLRFERNRKFREVVEKNKLLKVKGVSYQGLWAEHIDTNSNIVRACFKILHGTIDLEENIVNEIYPIKILNKYVSEDKQFHSSRGWEKRK